MMQQTFGICKLSVVPLRAEPSDRSEMISQLLFGDHFEILERQEKWVKIRCAYDDYEGWMDPKQVQIINQEQYQQSDNTVDLLGLKASHEVKSINGELYHLMPGTSLPNFQYPSFGWGENKMELEEHPLRQRPDAFDTEIETVSKFYLNAPYLWGGKTPFGIDCSGLTQIVFKQFGIRLKRDAWEQALDGELVAFLQESRTGDLAFFDNEEGRITHVGIMLGNSEIIHASGKVRIDPIDDQGIFNKELNRYTHKLRVIKRYV